jgi:hypothetical protein
MEAGNRVSDIVQVGCEARLLQRSGHWVDVLGLLQAGVTARSVQISSPQKRQPICLSTALCARPVHCAWGMPAATWCVVGDCHCLFKGINIACGGSSRQS